MVPNVKTNIHKYENTTQCTGFQKTLRLNLHVAGVDGIPCNYNHHQCTSMVLHASCHLQSQFLNCHFQRRTFNPSQCHPQGPMQANHRGKERCSHSARHERESRKKTSEARTRVKPCKCERQSRNDRRSSRRRQRI